MHVGGPSDVLVGDCSDGGPRIETDLTLAGIPGLVSDDFDSGEVQWKDGIE